MKTLKKLVIPNKVRNLIKFNRTVVIFLSFTMIILSNGASAQKVGITDDNAEPLTFAPKSLLHIHHELTTGSMFQITNSTSGDLATDGFLINLVITTNKLELINKENAGMSFGTSNTERMTILSGGNVGINATNPVEKLQIGGDVYITGGGGTIGGTTLANGWLKLGTTFAMDDNEFYYGTTGYIGTIGAFDLLFKLNGAERMRITSSGNIGIGITNPGYKLDINGDINVKNKIYLNGTATATKVLKTDGSGNPVWGVDDNTTYTGGTGINIASTTINNTAPWTDNSGSYIQNQNTVNQAANFRITGNGYLGGKVGIGTTSPGTKLDVAGNVNLNNVAYTGAGTLNRGYYVYKSATTAYGIKLHYDGSQYGTMVFGPNQANRFVNFGKVGAALEDDDMIEYMRIDLDNGNVGIGTTGPGYKLDVAGTGRFTNTLYANSNIRVDAGSTPTIFFDAAGTGDVGIRANGDNLEIYEPEDGDKIWARFTDDSNLHLIGTPHLYVDGNVGIGTTSPGQKLDVNGNIKLGDNIMVEGNGSYKIYRNLASYSVNTTQGAFVINTNQPWNGACMFRVKIEGYFYDATAPFEITIGAYMYVNDNFVNRGYINIGSKKLSVRLGRNTATNKIAIILGSEGTSYSYPKITVTQFIQGYSNINESYADGWTITQLTSLAGYDFLTTINDVTSANPSPNNTNYIWNQSATNQAANFRISGNGYIAGNVGIGTTAPSAKLEVAGWYGRTAHNNGGFVGSYNNVGANSTKTNPIYVIGSSYKPADATLGNMYGIGYTHTNASFITDPGPNSWGMYVASDGKARIWLAASSGGSSYFNAGNVGIGTTSPATKLEVQGGAIKATGGLIIETRTSDPASPATGQIWLRTDL